MLNISFYLSHAKYSMLLISDVVVHSLFLFNVTTYMKHLCNKKRLIYN